MNRAMLSPMPMRSVLAVSLAFVAVLAAGPSVAQRIGSLAQWKQRVLDPKPLDVALPEGAVFNMKFTIDQVRLDEGKDLMAVYVIPMDDLDKDAEFFAKQLGTTVEVQDRGTLGASRLVTAKPDDPKRAGLSIRVEPAPWATGKGWIWMRLSKKS